MAPRLDQLANASVRLYRQALESDVRELVRSTAEHAVDRAVADAGAQAAVAGMHASLRAAYIDEHVTADTLEELCTEQGILAVEAERAMLLKALRTYVSDAATAISVSRTVDALMENETVTSAEARELLCPSEGLVPHESIVKFTGKHFTATLMKCTIEGEESDAEGSDEDIGNSDGVDSDVDVVADSDDSDGEGGEGGEEDYEDEGGEESEESEGEEEGEPESDDDDDDDDDGDDEAPAPAPKKAKTEVHGSRQRETLSGMKDDVSG